MMKWHFLSLACLFVFTAQAQNNKGITVSGSIQSDILIPQDDEKIGTEKTSDDVQTNTYAEVNLMSEHVDAGVRFEYLEHPMPGFEKDLMRNSPSVISMTSSVRASSSVPTRNGASA